MIGYGKPTWQYFREFAAQNSILFLTKVRALHDILLQIKASTFRVQAIVGVPGPIWVSARPFFNLKFFGVGISAEILDSGFGASPLPAGTEK